MSRDIWTWIRNPVKITRILLWLITSCRPEHNSGNFSQIFYSFPFHRALSKSNRSFRLTIALKTKMFLPFPFHNSAYYTTICAGYFSPSGIVNRNCRFPLHVVESVYIKIQKKKKNTQNILISYKYARPHRSISLIENRHVEAGSFQTRRAGNVPQVQRSKTIKVRRREERKREREMEEGGEETSGPC